jgi:hypothetical protein
MLVKGVGRSTLRLYKSIGEKAVWMSHQVTTRLD